MDAPKVPNWLYSDRELERQTIGDIEAGSLRTAVNWGDGFEDCTDSDLVRAKDRLQKMDWVIELLERLANAQGS
jgi:hypothetical protein